MKLPRHAQVLISQSLARNPARHAPRPPCGKTTTRVAFFPLRSPNATAGQKCPTDARHNRPQAEISRGRLTPVLRLRLSGCCSSWHLCRKRRYFSYLRPHTTIGTQPAIEISHPRLLWVASVSYCPLHCTRLGHRRALSLSWRRQPTYFHVGSRFSTKAVRPSSAAGVVCAVAATAAPALSSVPKCSPIVSLSIRLVSWMASGEDWAH